MAVKGYWSFSKIGFVASTIQLRYQSLPWLSKWQRICFFKVRISNTNLSALQERDSEIHEIRETQQKDAELIEIMDHIQNYFLLSNDTKARRILLSSGSFYIDQ